MSPHSLTDMTRGFYIGRFQPFHEGHHAMVDRIREEIDELVVGIGSADKSHTVRNPFTAGERIMMITKALAEFEMTTYAVPIEDLNRNAVWVGHVQSMSPRFDVAYSNNPLVVRLFEEADIEVRQSPMFQRDEFEGTEVRQRMVNGDDWESLVPRTVAEVIGEIEGAERIQQISQTDTNGADRVNGNGDPADD
jgi:nicotinamide-nucleotide adenylyltransferase